MTVKAMIHSKGKIEEVTILRKREKDFIVETADGVDCTAVFNPLTWLYYADDIYGTAL